MKGSSRFELTMDRNLMYSKQRIPGITSLLEDATLKLKQAELTICKKVR